MSLGRERPRHMQQTPDLGRPRSGRVDDVRTRELSTAGPQAPALVRVDPRLEQRVAAEDLRAAGGGELGEQPAVEVAVEEAVAGAEEPSDEVLDRQVGNEPRERRAVEHSRVVHTERVLDADALFEGGELGGGGGRAR